MDLVEKYTREAKKFTGSEYPVSQEIKIWADSLAWAADQVKQGEFDNALKSLEQIKKVSGKLITMVKTLKKGKKVSNPGRI